MRTNTKTARPQELTHGGVPAYQHMTPIQALRRSVLACLLWEQTFYESGQSIADRIVDLSGQVTPDELAALSVEARSQFNLRHAPLLLLAGLAKHGKGKVVGDAIRDTIQRADEIAEFLSIYWRNGRTPLSKQVKRGLAMAFGKFTEYDLAKYNRDADIKLRDVLFMVHAKPSDKQIKGGGVLVPPVAKDKYKRGEVTRHPGSLLAKLVDDNLASPETWENRLSRGEDKKTVFEDMLRKGELGYLALLRNLRNMAEAGVSEPLVAGAILARNGAKRVLPFRYVAAARAAPQYEPLLDKALLAAIEDLPRLPGKTAVLVDVSGSMNAALSGKSDMNRIDAAATLASIINGDCRVFSFSEKVVEVPHRKGMAGVDAIKRSQPHGGTALSHAVDYVNKNVPHDRLICISDEQATDARVVEPKAPLAYMLNVAAFKNGVGYGKWQHIDGFSENVLRYIHELEKLEASE